jgi:hypothetical protein
MTQLSPRRRRSDWLDTPRSSGVRPQCGIARIFRSTGEVRCPSRLARNAALPTTVSDRGAPDTTRASRRARHGSPSRCSTGCGPSAREGQDRSPKPEGRAHRRAVASPPRFRTCTAFSHLLLGASPLHAPLNAREPSDPQQELREGRAQGSPCRGTPPISASVSSLCDLRRQDAPGSTIPTPRGSGARPRSDPRSAWNTSSLRCATDPERRRASGLKSRTLSLSKRSIVFESATYTCSDVRTPSWKYR